MRTKVGSRGVVKPKLSRYRYIRRFDDEHSTPVLAATDDGSSKDLLILLSNGWAEREISQQRLYDLLFDPKEAHNLDEDPGHTGVLEEMRGRLKKWMCRTKDPILDGPVPAPGGTGRNTRDQLPANDPTTTVA